MLELRMPGNLISSIYIIIVIGSQMRHVHLLRRAGRGFHWNGLIDGFYQCLRGYDALQRAKMVG